MNESRDARAWKLIHPGPPKYPNLSISITIQIRGEKVTDCVPKTLYSSHNYHFLHNIECSDEHFDLKVMIGRFSVLHYETLEPVIPKKEGKPVIKGLVEAVCKKTKDIRDSVVRLHGKQRVRFMESSYNHKRKPFIISIQYFTKGMDDQDILVCTLRSPPFKVFARKPTLHVQTLTNKPKAPLKRKKKSEQDGDYPDEFPSPKDEFYDPPKKKRKVKSRKPESEVLVLFKEQLARLESLRSQMSVDHRQFSSYYAAKRLMDEDEKIVSDYCMNERQKET